MLCRNTRGHCSSFLECGGRTISNWTGASLASRGLTRAELETQLGSMSEEEKEETDRKKREGLKKGEQYIENTRAAKEARK
jgi:hypothetical protein